VHFAWIIAAIFFVIWLVGFGLGRGESAGRHHFYRRELTTLVVVVGPAADRATRRRTGRRGLGKETEGRLESLAEGRPVLSGVCRERAGRP
jgi:hypothetical protein